MDDIFMWLQIDLVDYPRVREDDFYGERYSEPVLAANKVTGQVFDLTVVYDFVECGWCYAGLPDGADPRNYEVPVFTHFAYLPAI